MISQNGTLFLKMEHGFSKRNKVSQNGTWFLKMEQGFSEWNMAPQNGTWFRKIFIHFDEPFRNFYFFFYFSMNVFLMVFRSTHWSKVKIRFFSPIKSSPGVQWNTFRPFSSCWMMEVFSYKGTCSDLDHSASNCAITDSVFMTTWNQSTRVWWLLLCRGLVSYNVHCRLVPRRTANVRPFMCTSPRLSVW